MESTKITRQTGRVSAHNDSRGKPYLTVLAVASNVLKALQTGDTMSKRSASPPPAQGTLIKRSRSSEPQNTTQLVISSSGKEREQALIRTVKRTSNLEAPIVSLSGAHGVSCLFFENAVVLVANRRCRVKS